MISLAERIRRGETAIAAAKCEGRDVRKWEQHLEMLKRQAIAPRNIADRDHLNRPEFNALCEHLDDDNRDIVRFLYLSAWRSGEAMTLTWDKVDLNEWVIRLSRKNDKTKRPRTLTLVGELAYVINRRQARRVPSCPFVFHRGGRQIKSIGRQWQTAAVAVGLGRINDAEHYVGVTPHDMRRSAIRNLVKAGIAEAVGMSISGHKTNSTYKRYGIIDEDLQRQALERAQLIQEQESEARKVMPIKKAG